MYKTLRFTTILIFNIILVGVLSITSLTQEDDNIAYVIESITSISEQYTFAWSFENSSLIISDGVNDDFTWVESQVGEGFVILKDGVVSAISLSLEALTDIQGPGIILMDNLSFDVDLIYLNDVLYVHFENATGRYAELLGDIVGSEWINVSELPTELGNYVISLIGLETLIVESFGDLESLYQTEYVIGMVELGNDTLNEQELDGFTINIDLQVAFNSFAGISALSNSDDDLEELVNASTYETTLWIDSVSGLPYSIESVLALEVDIDSITTTLNSTNYTQFGDYNEPITIEAPEID